MGARVPRKVRRGRQIGRREYKDEKWRVYGDEKSLKHNPPSPHAYRQLLKYAHSPKPEVRRAAAAYLYAFLTSASAGHLVRFLKEPDPKTRYHAAISLGRYAAGKGGLPRNVVNVLINRLMVETNSSARKEMEGALGNSRDPKAMLALKRALLRYPADKISIGQALTAAARMDEFG